MRQKPPPLSPTVPPSTSPGKPRVTYESLLNKPDLSTLTGPVTIAPTPSTSHADGALTITETAKPDLILKRTESVAAVLQFIELVRNGSIKGFIALDASDRVAILHSDGTTVLFYVTLAGVASADVFDAGAEHRTAGTKVVGTQGGAIADGTATTGSPDGTNSTGGSPSDPAFLGDVQGAYDVTNAQQADISNAAGTAATALAKANAALAAMRAHGLIAP